jgi:hypothetical protein
MKTLIEKIQDLTLKPMSKRKAVGYIAALADMADIIRATPVIKAKALRRKGTDDDWYRYCKPEDSWHIVDYPDTFDPDVEMEDIHTPPADAELVNITIIVE